MTREQLEFILTQWKQIELDVMRESQQAEGSTYLRERIATIAERCARDWEGDLVEIGCLNGSATVLLARVARLYNRRVIAIDPWQIGTQNCDGGEYEIFAKTIFEHRDIVDVLRLDSRDVQVKDYLAKRELCFGYVDGLHTYEAAKIDIANCSHARIVCVDDLNWNLDVRRAFEESPRDKVFLESMHEGWLV